MWETEAPTLEAFAGFSNSQELGLLPKQTDEQFYDASLYQNLLYLFKGSYFDDNNLATSMILPSDIETCASTPTAYGAICDEADVDELSGHITYTEDNAANTVTLQDNWAKTADGIGNFYIVHFVLDVTDISIVGSAFWTVSINDPCLSQYVSVSALEPLTVST